MLRKFRKAQGVTEYAIFIAAVLAGLLALQVYYSRTVKGNVKARADSIGEQFNTKEGQYVYETTSVASRKSIQGFQQITDGNVTSTSAIATGALDAGFATDITSVVGSIAKNYKGGEITSSAYTNQFNGSTVAGLVPGEANLGKVQSNDTVWNDSGI